ncbi:MAG: condensation domain-containing protein [Bacteroidota bacterium]
MQTDFAHEVFEEIVRDNPLKTAIRSNTGDYTYEKLDQNANNLASIIDTLGVTVGDAIGVIIPPDERLVRSLLATFKMGGIYIPIDIAFSRKRWIEIFADNQPGVLITTEELRDEVVSILQGLEIDPKFLIALSEDGEAHVYQNLNGEFSPFSIEVKGDFLKKDLSPDDGNYIIYTSGSTGKGKAILGCHKGLTHFIRWEIKEFNITDTDNVSMLSQHTFDASLRDILVPLCAGATLHIPEKEIKSNLTDLISWIDQSQISLIHCVPSLFRLLTKELAATEGAVTLLQKLKHILMAGEPLYAKDISSWQEIGNNVELVNLYGTSETTLAKTFHRVKDIPENPAQVIHGGKPIDNAFIAILNGKRLCRIGEIGEIYIKTPYMTKGYPHDKTLHNQVFVQNPLIEDKEDIIHKTGDLGRYLPDRSVEVLGRLDNQVKVNGVRIELNEIDKAVMSLAGVEEVASVVYKRTDNQNELVCYFVGKEVTDDELRAHLRIELNENIQPSYLIKLDELPLNLNGKVDKKALPKPEHILLSGTKYQAPTTATEEKLEAIWQEILGLKKIGTEAAFFKIGGSSLKAMQMVSRIFKEFNVAVKVSHVLSHPTIGALAEIVDNLSQSQTEAILPVPQAEHYALSHAQKRIWVMSQFSDDASHNMTDALLLEGSVNVQAFEKAFLSLIERHESLRTTFIVLEDEPRQKINSTDESGFALGFENLSATGDSEERAKEIAAEEFAASFDLEKGPLLRAKLLKLSHDRFVFLFTIHHIIADGWSLEVLTRELVTFYDAYANDKPVALSPLAIHYKDFSAWQNDQLSETRVEKLKHYWLEQMGGTLPNVQLPKDRIDLDENRYGGDRANAILSEGLSAKIRSLAEQEDATLFMTLLSAYYLLIYEYTGQTDVIIGCPATGREHPDLEGQIGIYLNTLPLRVTFNQSDSFRTLLRKVKATAVNGFDHQLYPFDRLVEDLGLGGKGSQNPLFNVMFDMLEFGATKSDTQGLNGIEIKPFYSVHNTNKADLTLYAYHMNSQLHLHLGYDTKSFKKNKVERMIERLLKTLEQVVDNPDTKIETFSSDDEVELSMIQPIAR